MTYECGDPMCNSKNYIDIEQIKQKAKEEYKKGLIEYMENEIQWEDDHHKLGYENAMFDVSDYKFLLIDSIPNQ